MAGQRETDALEPIDEALGRRVSESPGRNEIDNMEGRGDLTMASISLQDLQRRLYDEAKAEKTKRFWGLYVHVAKRETLGAAYEIAKQHNGAPGIDGVTFAAIEAEGDEGWPG
jgi:RNA-directed DNA polymerase